MKTTKDTIKHISNLIRLKVDEETSESFSKQVSEILEYVNILRELDTTDVQPTNQVTGLKNIFRDDVIKEYPEHKKTKLFREVPNMKKGYIVVPHPIIHSS